MLFGLKLDHVIEMSLDDLYFYACLPFVYHLLVYVYLAATLYLGYRNTRLTMSELLGGWTLANLCTVIFFHMAHFYLKFEETQYSIYFIICWAPCFLEEGFLFFFCFVHK
jgi:hypothetical protein